MRVKFKKLSKEAVSPSYAKNGDAGMDLTSVSKALDDYGNIVYGTGLAFEIPDGYVGLLFPRSSNAKKDMLLSNSVGVLDSGYRGEVMFKYKPSLVFTDCNNESNMNESVCLDELCNTYNTGERIGQLIIIPYPKIELEESCELSETDRGSGGYGSSGK